MNQRMEALEIANRKRSAISKMRKRLKAGDVTLAEVLNDPDCGPSKVATIVGSQRGWGPVRTARLLDIINVRPLTRLDKLTTRQKDMIVKVAETGAIMTDPPTAQELDELEVGVRV